MNWTFICVLGVLLINIIIGIKKGLIKMIFSMVSIIVIVAVTSLAAPHICSCLKENTDWDEKVYDRTADYFQEHGMLVDSEGFLDTDKLPLPNSIQKNIDDNAGKLIEEGAEAYNNYVTGKVAGVIFSAAVYVASFIVISIILLIIGCLLNIVSRLPVLNQINRISGGIVGLVIGVLVVWIGFIIITVLGNTPFAAAVFRQIDSNPFLTFMYNKNIIMNLILNIF